MGSEEESTGDWYCANCGYLPGSRVTFSETCDECHIPVKRVEHDEKSVVATKDLEIQSLRDQLTKAMSQLGERAATIHSLDVQIVKQEIDHVVERRQAERRGFEAGRKQITKIVDDELFGPVQVGGWVYSTFADYEKQREGK